MLAVGTLASGPPCEATAQLTQLGSSCRTVVPSPDVSGDDKHANPSLGNAYLRDPWHPSLLIDTL